MECGDRKCYSVGSGTNIVSWMVAWIHSCKLRGFVSHNCYYYYYCQRQSTGNYTMLTFAVNACPRTDWIIYWVLTTASGANAFILRCSFYAFAVWMLANWVRGILIINFEFATHFAGFNSLARQSSMQVARYLCHLSSSYDDGLHFASNRCCEWIRWCMTF